MPVQRPGLTKTQALRQAKSAAYVKQYEEKKTETGRPQATLPRKRKPPAPEPKKVDFSKPGLTKTMLARMKHAEKLKEDYSRKQEAEAQIGRRPKRTPAPIGGDARAGRERSARRDTTQKAIRAAPPAKAPLSQKTRNLAKTINAEVVQAEPIIGGTIDNIVIPAGTIKGNRTTIIAINQSKLPETSMAEIANRSMQVISETLDEQDAVEAEAVQSKLDDLQQARRDFVMAVANVGGNAVNIEDTLAGKPPATPPRYLYKVPELDDPILQIEYTMDHPIIEAAREFLKKSLAAMEEREAAKRLDQEFQRLAQQETSLRMDVPFEEELYQDQDISWEEDEEMGMKPIPSRIKATLPPIPQRQEPYKYSPFDPEELEQFFDVERYPPCPPSPPCGPPPGREHLHPDLWELEDPWYMPPPEPDVPDLIQFD